MNGNIVYGSQRRRDAVLEKSQSDFSTAPLRLCEKKKTMKGIDVTSKIK
jgi:hypothetical protein